MKEEKHDSRCSKCKSTIYSFLFQLFGEVQFKYKPNSVSTRLQAYSGTRSFKPLTTIYNDLVEIDGRKSFIKARTLQRCDLYIPKKGILIETDEIQHFTYARYISLRRYPAALPIGFDRKWYMLKCNEVRSVDRDPIYRDEQRAWYDTLRDFLPWISTEVKLTVRIPLGFHAWCSLDSKNKTHIAAFKKLISLGG